MGTLGSGVTNKSGGTEMSSPTRLLQRFKSAIKKKEKQLDMRPPFLKYKTSDDFTHYVFANRCGY